MSDTPVTSADLVSNVLNATNRLAKSRRRLMSILIVVLLVAIAVLGIYIGNLRAANNSKDSMVDKQQLTIAALTKKSAEQTIAEVELRNDVNRLSKLGVTVDVNHSVSLNALCALMVKDDVPEAVIAKDCPK